MKVRFESAKCDGFGACAVHAPTVFELDEWGYASLTNKGEIDEADLPAVQRAVLDCPVHAIHLQSE